ncbi:MAG: PPC domain-containing protein [Planctomycetaceae bacterium]|nr:PPC domain-containing protein [Planctomycetaceae bacterium]
MSRWKLLLLAALGLSCGLEAVHAQLVPEIGYVHPAGGQAGTTVDVTLGGYDWTPDMQLLLHDPRIKLEIIGPPSPVLVPEPPYWFGYKARGMAWPCPREFKAKLTIPADVPPGLVKWQVANANGASPVESFHIGSTPEVIEDAKRKTAQVLPAFPVTVSGQIRRIEEIDRYQFRVPKAGPVTIELLARRMNSPLHGMLQVRDANGNLVLDASDSEGRDLTLTMIAQADTPYELRLHDLDFAGDRSYVYRLLLTPGSHVVAAYPAAGKRGEVRKVEFIGIGLATGGPQLETVTRDVTFPAAADVKSFAYSLETPFGNAKPHTLLVTDLAEQVEAASGATPLTAPSAVTGAIDSRFGSDQFTVELKKGDKWDINAQARAIGSPLDLELQVLGPDGKQVATNDDEKGTTDASLTLAVPADGPYRILVVDRSGKSGLRTANYRLSIEPPREEVTITFPTQLPIVVGAPAKLAIKVVRDGGFAGPIPLKLEGLPAGVTVPADLAIPEKKNDLVIDLTCAADAATTASLCTITATPTLNGQPSTRKAGTVLLATTMKPRLKLTPEGLDDVSKVHRGSTHLFPFKIERLEGYVGPITLEMTAKQQRHRQGLSSDEMVVPPEVVRAEYPIFVPEWMETTKTSRMIINGAVKVADPKGNVRTLLQKQELRVGILPEGALMKLSHSAGEPTVTLGTEVRIPLALSLASELRESIRITVMPDETQTNLLVAEPIQLSAGQKETTLIVRVANDAKLIGEQSLVVRAATLRNGYPVISETTVLLTVKPQ